MTLSPSQRFNLGLRQVDRTYPRVRSSIRGLARLLEHLLPTAAHEPFSTTHEDPQVDSRTGEVADCGTDGDRPPVSLDELACALLNAAIPDSVLTTGAMAIDGTDIETWAHAPYGTKNEDRPACWDPDARFGHRTATTNHPGDLYLGYAAHLGGELRQRLRRDRPAHPHATRSWVTECVADRGYTMATAEHFAEPAHQLGISIDMDLHTYQQTQHPGLKAGTLWVDGTLYSTAPERLRHIAAPSLAPARTQSAWIVGHSALMKSKLLKGAVLGSRCPRGRSGGRAGLG